MLLLLMMVAGVTSALAQNVTISAKNGSLICAGVGGQGTSGGAFAMWRHEQLALTMIVAENGELTEDGILKNHKNWFNSCNNCTFRSNVTADQKATFIDCGWQNTGYYTISLPKGYRFTSYSFELSHDITNTGQGFTTTTNTSVTFAETNSTFNTNVKSVTLPAVPNSASAVQVFTLSRTDNDMGNVLYFKATNPNGDNRMYDLTFLLQVPFNTGKVDIGQVERRNTGSGYRISYSLNNFKDMSANMLLYEYGSTQSGTGFDGTSGLVAYDKTGSITTSGNYFRFAPDVVTESNKPNEMKYVLETPVSAIQAGNIVNVAYVLLNSLTEPIRIVLQNVFECLYVRLHVGGRTSHLSGAVRVSMGKLMVEGLQCTISRIAPSWCVGYGSQIVCQGLSIRVNVEGVTYG